MGWRRRDCSMVSVSPQNVGYILTSKVMIIAVRLVNQMFQTLHSPPVLVLFIGVFLNNLSLWKMEKFSEPNYFEIP